MNTFKALIIILILCSSNCLAKHDLCEAQIRLAENKHGIPNKLLDAIARVESGKWPWTVQCSGKSHYFDSKDQAVNFVEDKLKNGTRKGDIDVGCMQINVGAHGDKFSNIDQMFDPIVNIDYGAKHLKNHKQQVHSWLEAAGNYHSMTPEHHNKYKGLVTRAWGNDDVTEMINKPTRIEFLTRPKSNPRAAFVRQTPSIYQRAAVTNFKSLYGRKIATRPVPMRKIKTTEMRWFALKK